MQVISIKTHLIKPSESLEKVLDQYITTIVEKDIIAITSKIISICQSRIVSKNIISKENLIKKEADAIADTDHRPYGIYLTIKNNILIPSAGIDESNANNAYILYPNDIQQTANFIWNFLRNKFAIKNLGIIITDSHTTPLRQGVTGICIGWCGFKPLYSYVGKPDLHGNPLQVTHINLLDAIATASVLVMGEGNEQTPIAIVKDAPKISFLNREPNAEEQNSVTISIEHDLYAPLIMGVNWQYNN